MNPAAEITELVLKTISDIDSAGSLIQWLETLKNFRDTLESINWFIFT
jgi:hypothetical protein